MNHQARIQAAVAGIVALGLASLVAAQPVPQPGHRKVLRRGQGRPERLRYRQACLRRPGRQGRQGSERMEIRCQGHVRIDGRQDDGPQVAIATRSAVRPRPDRVRVARFASS